MEMPYKCLYTKEKRKKDQVQFKKCDCWLAYVHLTKVHKFTTKLPRWLCTALSV